MADPRLLWLVLWQTPWKVADNTWRRSLTNDVPERALMLLDPAALRARQSLAGLPPKPADTLLALVNFSPEQQLKALHIVAEVVERGAGGHDLDHETRLWCRRLAKAMMPGQWVYREREDAPGELIGLGLLRQWLTVSSWSRVRYLYRKPWVDEVEHWGGDAPPRKLNQLWNAVIWLISQSPATAAPSAPHVQEGDAS
ncbi:hypothetical protein ACKC9G_15900 [Pokkaliibacter sp. CJK22405]|uniref:hypothetical protein n=1 Tax=Pokkaliibacter sp. CJK22405 TaxID=3384615 RepID=UPI003984A2E3